MSELFFKRSETKYKHGLTEKELIEALKLYDKKVKREIYEEVKAESGVDFSEHEDVKKVIDNFIDKAFTEGMKCVENTSLVIDYYKEVRGIQTDDRCGVLDVTDNQFYPCIASEHWKTVTKILEEKYNHLYDPFMEMMFASKGLNEYGGVTRDYLDKFILRTFKFLGEYIDIDFYLEDAKSEY